MTAGSDGEPGIPTSSVVARRSRPRATRDSCDANLEGFMDLCVRYILSLQILSTCHRFRYETQLMAYQEKLWKLQEELNDWRESAFWGGLSSVTPAPQPASLSASCLFFFSNLFLLTCICGTSV